MGISAGTKKSLSVSASDLDFRSVWLLFWELSYISRVLEKVNIKIKTTIILGIKTVIRKHIIKISRYKSSFLYYVL